MSDDTAIQQMARDIIAHREEAERLKAVEHMNNVAARLSPSICDAIDLRIAKLETNGEGQQYYTVFNYGGRLYFVLSQRGIAGMESHWEANRSRFFRATNRDEFVLELVKFSERLNEDARKVDEEGNYVEE